MKCINKTNPDYQRVLDEAVKYGYDPFVFELKTSRWLNNRDTEAFPTIRELEPQIAGLFDVLNDLGISLTTIEEWQKLSDRKLADNVEALADPLRNLIAFKQGKLTKDRLSEEIVHIMMSHSKYASSRDYGKALKYVERTDEWKSQGQEYTKTYGSEELAKREILHKIGSKVLLKNMELEKSNNSLVRVLKRIWENFMALFSNKTKLENYMNKLMKKVNMGNEVVDTNVYYSLAREKARAELQEGKVTKASLKEIQEMLKIADEEEVPYLNEVLQLKKEGEGIYKRNNRFYSEEALINVISKEYPNTIATDEEFDKIINEVKSLLKKRYESEKRQGTLSGEKRLTYSKYIEALDIESNAYKRGEGLLTFLQELRNNSKRVFEFLKSGDDFNQDNFFAIVEFFSYYEPMIESLRDYLINRPEYDADKYTKNFLPKVAEKELLEVINQTLNEYFVAKNSLNNNILKLSIKLMRDFYKEKFNINESNNNVADKLINEQLYNFKEYPEYEEMGKDYKKELKKTYEDISWLEAKIIPGKDVNDNTIRLIASLVTELNQNITHDANNWIKETHDEFKDFSFKNYDFALERLDNGDVTGYFSDEIRHGFFESERKNFFEELYAKYKVPKDFDEKLARTERIKNLRKAVREDPTLHLLDSEKKLLKEDDQMHVEIRNWYLKNTVPIDDAESIYQEMINKEDLPEQELEIWLNRNVGTYYYYSKAKKQVKKFRYFKGDLIKPSDGRIKKAPHATFSGKPENYSYQTKDYRNKQWGNLSQKQKNFIKKYIETKKSLAKNLPGNHNPYELVQMEEDMVGAMLHKDKNLFKRIKSLFKGTLLNREDDSLDYGDQDSIERGVGGFVIRHAPVHLVKKLKEPNNISRDLMGALNVFAQSVFNYQQKAKYVRKLMVIEQQLNNREVNINNRKKKGYQSKASQAFSTFLDMNIQDVRTTKYGDKINWSKGLRIISDYTRAANLWGNIGTIVTSAVSPRIFELNEALLGRFLDMETYKDSLKIYYKHAAETAMDGINAVKKAKLNVMAESAGIIQLAKQLDRNFLLRENIMYQPYTMPSVTLGTKVLIGFTINVRKDSNGQWVDKKLFKGTKEEWKKMPTLFDQIRVDEKGVLIVPDEAIKQWTKVKVKTQDFLSRIEGRLTREEKSAIHQDAIFSMLTIHRNWFIRGISDRFKAKGYNFVLDMYDQGSYYSAYEGISKMFFKNTEEWHEIGKKLLKWNELNDREKYGIKLVMSDIAKTAIFMTLALFVHAKIKEDEDEEREPSSYLVMTSYLLNRTLLEMSSFININEYVTVLSNPLTPLKYIEYFSGWTDLFSGEEIEKGPYEGYRRWQKFILRLIPGVRGYFGSTDPKSANLFLMQKPLQQVPWEFGERMFNENYQP